jgi:hypothetical protein
MDAALVADMVWLKGIPKTCQGLWMRLRDEAGHKLLIYNFS